jgi:tRNA1Val (adenine37-N6)-methyltransferase
MDALTSERFASSGLTLSQPAHGHRYGRESLALASFVNGCEGLKVCELGSGVGVVALQIAARERPAHVTAVELQSSLHAIALKNVEANGLHHVVTCVNDDIRAFAREYDGAFDIVVANPPFFTANKGRLSPDPQRAGARHELNGSIADFIQAARTLLRDDGRLFIVFDKRRKEELENAARACDFEIARIEEPHGETYVLREYAYLRTVPRTTAPNQR